jgi:hypothetical protein
MSTHTPEPWAVNPLRAHVDAFDTGVPIPVCQLLWPTEDRSEAETEANGHRIVSCVNALQGVPDPAAYVKAFEEMRAALKATYNVNPWSEAWRDIRDDALALAEAAHPVLDAQLRASVALLGEKGQ